MKQLSTFISLTLLIFFFSSCNDSATKETAVRDSIASVQEKTPDSAAIVLNHINDSLNLVISNFTEVMEELQDSSQKYTGEKRAQILNSRAKINDVRDSTLKVRDGLTSGAIAALGVQLTPVINKLTTQLQSLQKLSEKIQAVITIMGLIDKTLSSAITAGILTPPVSIASLPLSQAVAVANVKSNK